MPFLKRSSLLLRALQLMTFLVLSSFFVVACLDEIDVNVPSSGPEQYVIQGKVIIGSPTQVHVRISKLFDFTASTKSPIKARWVRLYDEDGNYLELEDGSQGDYYLTLDSNDPNFPIALGRGYYMELSTFDGRLYRSDIEKGIPVPKADKLSYELVDLPAFDAQGRVVLTEHVQYRISTPLAANETSPRAYLNWLTEWTFKVNDSPYQTNVDQKVCYITEQLGITSFNSLDPNALAEEYLEDQIIYENLVLRNYAEGLYFTVIQESLTETAYEYYRQIGQNTDRSGSMFDEPPGSIVSNIKNTEDEKDKAFGFFYVTQQDTIRTYVSPQSVGSPPFYCPPPQGIVTQSGNCADLICCDCLSVANSTVSLPSFWEE